MALTATATTAVRRDVQTLLRMRSPRVYIQEFNRPNLRCVGLCGLVAVWPGGKRASPPPSFTRGPESPPPHTTPHLPCLSPGCIPQVPGGAQAPEEGGCPQHAPAVHYRVPCGRDGHRVLPQSRCECPGVGHTASRPSLGCPRVCVCAQGCLCVRTGAATSPPPPNSCAPTDAQTFLCVGHVMFVSVRSVSMWPTGSAIRCVVLGPALCNGHGSRTGIRPHPPPPATFPPAPLHRHSFCLPSPFLSTFVQSFFRTPSPRSPCHTPSHLGTVLFLRVVSP
jgi:hypothetical protein